MKFGAMEFPAMKRYAPLNYTDVDSLPTKAIPQPLAGAAPPAETTSELDISMTPEKLSSASCGILKRPEASRPGSKKASRRQVRFHLSESQETGSAPPSPDLPRVTEKMEEGSSPVTMTVLPQNWKLGMWDSHRSSNATSVFALSDAKAFRKDALRPSKSKAPKSTRPAQQAGAFPELPQIVMEAEFCPLGTPEYNTTLALGQEMMEATEKGFDVKRAVEQQLRKSSVLRQCVEGKVAEGMNIPKDQQLFQGLVSLDVSVDQVLSSAVQKLQVVKPRSDPKKESVTEAPDLMMFYNPSELFWEMPFLAMEGLPPLRPQAHVKPRQTAFDMYRKLQEWDA